MKIGVLGSDDFVTGFKLAGVEKAFTVDDNLIKVFEEAVADEEVSVLVMHTKDMEKLPPRIAKRIEKMPRPVIIGVSEEEGEGNLNQLIKRCIGIDISAKK